MTRAHHIETVGISTSPTSIRMVCVTTEIAFGPDDKVVNVWHTLIPVVAIQTSILRCYSMEHHPVQTPTMTHPTHRDMLGAGWKYDGMRRKIVPLCASQSVGITEVDCGMIGKFGGKPCAGAEYSFMLTAVYACEWPPSQDEERLSKQIEQLDHEAIDQARRRRREHRED